MKTVWGWLLLLRKNVQEIPGLRHASQAEIDGGHCCDTCQYFRDAQLYCWQFDSPVQCDWVCNDWELKKVDNPDSLTRAEQ